MNRICCLLAVAVTILMVFPLSADEKPTRPTLYIIGDSTVRNGSGKGDSQLWGWGEPIADLFDKTKIDIKNRAIGGRSSRTFLTEGKWDAVMAELKPGDFVLMQFGHNDNGDMFKGRARASIHGTGDETKEGELESTKQKEVVHTYGWYLKKYITDAKSKGATPIVLSPIPRNMWKDGKVARADKDYGKWAAESAHAAGAAFVDLNAIIADKYDAMGEEKVAEFFTQADHTHTNLAGAKFNAACVVEGLQGLKDCALCGYLANRK